MNSGCQFALLRWPLHIANFKLSTDDSNSAIEIDHFGFVDSELPVGRAKNQ
jgi:hypothetical protein